MATWRDFDPGTAPAPTPQDPAGQPTSWRSFVPATPAPPAPPDPNASTGLAGDIGREFGTGLNQLAALAGVGLRKLGAERAGTALKEIADERIAELQGQLTPAQQEAQATPFLSGELTPTQGLRKIAGTAAQSLPSMALGAGVGAGVTRGLLMRGVGTTAAGVAGGAIGEGTVGAGLNYLDVYDQALAKADLDQTPEYQEALAALTEGSDEEKAALARDKAASALALRSAGQVGLATAVLGAPSGLAFARLLGGETGKTLLRTVGKQAGLEALQEGPQSAVETFVTGQTLGTPATAGDLAESVIAGILTGGAIGGTMGGVGQVLGERQLAAKLGVNREALKGRIQEVLAFKAANPEVELSAEDVQQHLAGAVTLGTAQETPETVLETSTNVPELRTTVPEVGTAAPISRGGETQPTAATPNLATAQQEPERLGLPAPTNVALPSGEVLTASQFYQMLNERITAQSGAMTKEAVIRARRRLKAEEERFFEVQAIREKPEAERSAAEKARLTKYQAWLQPTVPAAEVLENPTPEITAALAPEPVKDLTPAVVPATLPETTEQGGEGVRSDIEAVRAGKVSAFTEAVRQLRSAEGTQFATTPDLAGQVLDQSSDGVLFVFGGTGTYLLKEGGKFYERRLGTKEQKISREDAAIALAAVSLGFQRRSENKPITPTEPPKGGVSGSEGVTNDLPAVQQEGESRPAPLPDVRPEPQGDAEVAPTLTDAQKKREARIAGWEAAVAQAPDTATKADMLEAAARNAFSSNVLDQILGTVEALAPAEAGDLDSNLGRVAYEISQRPTASEVTKARATALYERLTFSPPGENLPVRENPPASAPPAADNIPARESEGTLPRLKRGWKREYFVVDKPSYAGNVFVEDVSPKGKKTLYVRRRDGSIKPASPGLIPMVEGQPRTAYAGPQFAEEVSPVAALTAMIQKETGLPVAAGMFAEVQPPKGSETLFAELEDALGKRIVFFRAKGSPVAFNGVTGLVADTLFVNIDSTKPHLLIAGHEFLHDLKREDPETYWSLREAVMATIPETERQKWWKAFNEKRQREGRRPMTLAGVDEELVADFFGKQFMRKDFWVRVERQNPEGFAGLVQRLMDFLGRLAARVTTPERADYLRAQEVAAEALARYARKNPEAAAEAKFAAAWHGSPHDFGEFKLQHIGTGEGAQAYGWGLYFAGNREVAEFYKDALAKQMPTTITVDGSAFTKSEALFGGTSPTDRVVRARAWAALVGAKGDVQAAIDDITLKWLKGDQPEAAQKVSRSAIDKLERLRGSEITVTAPEGRLYQVNLAPAEDDYLLWDKPLTEQSEKVRKALANAGGQDYPQWRTSLNAKSIAELQKLADTIDRNNTLEDDWDDATSDAEKRADILGFFDYLYENDPESMESYIQGGFGEKQSGQGIYFQLATGQGSHEAASKYLLSLGIPGIKYLDGMSRGKGDGNFNYVLFDDSLVTIEAKFAEDLTRTARRNLAGLVQALRSGSVTTAQLPKVLKVTPEPIVVEVWKGSMPRIEDLYKTRKRRDALRNEIVDYAGILHGQITAKAKKGVGVKAVENAAALASFHQMWPNKDLMEQDWVPAAESKGEALKRAQRAWENAGMAEATGLSFVEAYRRSREAFDALKDSALKEDYLRAVESMASLRQREKDNLQRVIEQATAEDPALRAELLAKLDATFSNLKGAYWPLYREGKYFLEYMDPAMSKGDPRTVESFETAFEREQAMAALKEMGVDPETFKPYYKGDVPQSFAVVPENLMQQFDQAVRSTFQAGVDQTDTDAVARANDRAAETIRELTQIWLRWQPETSALKNSIKRRNVKGFSLNMLRGFLRYSQAHGGRIAHLEEGRKVQNLLEEIAGDLKQRKNEGEDTTRLDQVLEDLRAREDAGKNIGVNKLAQQLGKWTTFWYMTSPSIALVQMTQLGVLTLPKLSVMFSPAKAATAIGRGIQAAFSPKYTRQAMFADVQVAAVFDDLQAVVTPDNRPAGRSLGEPLYTPAEMRAKIATLNPEQQRLLALRVAMARNLLDISLSHEVGEIVRGGDPGQVESKVFRGMMSFMRVSETASRKAAILAAFDAATGSGQDFYQAMDAVEEVVESTLYNYSKDAKGVLMQGSTARVLLTFQHFRIMTAFKLALLFKQSFRGAEPEVRSAARRELVGIFGMSGLLAGGLGMPFVPILFKLLDTVLGDEDEPYDSEREFRQWLSATLGETGADVALEGPASLLGTALSRRIGLGDVVGSQSEMPAYLHGDGAAAWWATQMLGPSYAMVAGFARGYDQMVNEGEVMKGLEAATPKPVKDVLKAYALASDGVKTGLGKRLLSAEEVGANEVLLLALGFQPLQVSKLRDTQRDLDRMSTTISRRRGQLVQDFVKAHFESGDTGEQMAAVLRFNEKLPEFSIGGADLRQALREYLRGDLGVESRRETLVRRRMGENL